MRDFQHKPSHQIKLCTKLHYLRSTNKKAKVSEARSDKNGATYALGGEKGARG